MGSIVSNRLVTTVGPITATFALESICFLVTNDPIVTGVLLTVS